MPNSSLLKALERITTAQQAGVKRLGESQSENMFMQLIKTLINKVEIAKGDKGDKPVAGIDYFIPKNGIDGGIGAKGDQGDSIKGDKGDSIVGKTGATGATGKDGMDASITEMKSISDKEAKKAIKEHDKEYDHKLIHDSITLGKLELDEESIKEGAILQIKGNKLVAVDMPKQPYFARPAAAHSRYQIQTITKSTTIDPLMNVVHVDATTGDVTLTLYEAAGNEGSYTFIKRIDDPAVTGNDVTFAVQGGENIEFEALYMLVNEGSGAEVYSNGTDFFFKHT